MGGALRYFLNEYEYLTGYLKDGRLEADNGFTERAIRKYAIGRNAWLFSDTPRGGRGQQCHVQLHGNSQNQWGEPLRGHGSNAH
ncbi:MAG: transposase [Bdellovibrionales bacterium]|nr:transposase [Bdellovibrionales bacterium]